MKSSALEIACFSSGLKERGIFPVYWTSYYCVKRIFALWLEERDLKSSALEERGIFQVIRVYGLFRSMALKTRHIKPYTKLAAFAYVKRRKSL